MSSGLTAERALDVVSSFYEAALEPQRWPDVLPRLLAAMGAERAVMGFVTSTPGQTNLSLTHEVDVDLLRVWESEFDRLDPWYERAGVLPTGTIVRGVELISWDERQKTEIEHAILAPLGFDDLLCLVLANHGVTHDFVTVYRRRTQATFTREDERGLRTLSPHLILAAQVYQRLSQLDRTRTMERALLDALPFGTILVDLAGRVVAMNGEASRIMAARDGLSVRGGRLQASQSAADESLHAAFARAREDLSGRLLVVRRASLKRPYQVLVAPVPQASHERLFANDTEPLSTIVIVSDPEVAPRPAADVLRRAFGLTPALSRLAAALAAGSTVQEFARSARVSTGTARQQLKELFARTGTHRQAELVAALLSGVAQLRL